MPAATMCTYKNCQRDKNDSVMQPTWQHHMAGMWEFDEAASISFKIFFAEAADAHRV